ncbi:hypothetical protein [Methanoregula sp.]|uniref:hypothetical protein n=1 Tax=Methanoregula sp. TaxID=2052170 RepID=UPI002368FAB3|nr:hypothetical protein [Methanoregula sp.]MDD1686347.1 hypothetical protein [Methanoregula sp.]
MKKVSNRFCIFHIWWKFLSFFITFLFVFIPSAIGVYWIFKTENLQEFFTGYDISILISNSQNSLINSTSFQNSILGNLIYPKGITDIAFLFGCIIVYCAFFEYVKNRNIFDSNQTTDYAKLLNFFTYAFFASLFYDCIIIWGYFQGWFKDLSNDQFIEVFFLFTIALMALLNIIIVYYLRSKNFDNYENLVKLSFYLERINFSKDFQSLSIYIFFLTILVPFFGALLSFNILSIIFIDLQLIYIIAILGFLNSLPRNVSIIQFKTGDSIPDAFLLHDSEIDSILVLTTENQKKKIMKDTIFWTSKNNELPLNNVGITQIGNITIVKSEDCLNLVNVSWPLLLIFSAISIFLGYVLKILLILLPVPELRILTLIVCLVFLFSLGIVGYLTSRAIQ